MPAQELHSYLDKLHKSSGLYPVSITRSCGTETYIPRNYGDVIQMRSSLDKISRLVAPFSDSFQPLLTDLCITYFRHFSSSADSVLPFFITSFKENPQNQCSVYVRQVEAAFIEAAALGYPSVLQAFCHIAKDRPFSVTQRDQFDFRNLLALRVYLADGLSQADPTRKKALRTLQEQKEIGQANPKKVAEEISNIFGSMVQLYAGTLKDRPYIPDQNREGELTTYLPDYERMKALLELGDICGRLRRSDRTETFRTVGNLSKPQLLQLFPSINAIEPSASDILRVEHLFDCTYEEAEEYVLTHFFGAI